jgi:DNA-binding transcriptional LysR family regulator
MGMEFKRGQLRNFVVVAEEGQMTRAAKRLHLAQPALSHTIAQLESELGLVLLERHARGVTLTPAGETFLTKARAALAAADDALMTAQALARASRGTMEVGYIGPPPMVNAPELFEAFADTHPDATVSYRELPFPYSPTMSWLEEVDVAFSHAPLLERGVRSQAVRAESRAVVAPANHPLAQRSEVAVAELLDELFLSYHPEVQPSWAGFHSLEDHRGAPAPHVTDDHARTPAEMLSLMASRRAITTVPLSDARVIRQVLRGVVVIPVRDAEPAVLSLTWREDHQNPCVDALVALAEALAAADGVARLGRRTVATEVTGR